MRKKFRPPARGIMERSRDAWAQHQSSIAERVKLLPIDMKRIGRTAERVVHGLHFHHTGRVLPPGYEPKVVHGGRMPTVARLDIPILNVSSRHLARRNGNRSAAVRLEMHSHLLPMIQMLRCGFCRSSEG